MSKAARTISQPKYSSSRRKFIGLVSAVGLVAPAAVALAGCGSSNNSSSTRTTISKTTSAKTPRNTANGVKRGGNLLIGSDLEASTLDPATGQSGGDHKYLWTMFDNLVAISNQGKADSSLSLAKSWEIVDPTTITFHLRDGVTFHDGTTFNADAVKYNIQRVQNPTTKSSAQPDLEYVASVETPDPHTVTLKLSKPDGALLLNLTDRGGMMASPAAVEKYGSSFGRNPVGTGPFTFESWTQGSSVKCKKNPKYWRNGIDNQPLPYVDSIDMQLVPEPVVMLADLEQGNLNTIPLSPTVRPKIADNHAYVIDDFKGSSWAGVYINQTLGPMKDVRMRQALAYATNKQAMTQGVTLGLSPVALGPITPPQFPWDPNLPNVPSFDPTKAKQLISAAGMDGATIEVLSYPPEQQGVTLWQSMLKAVGLDVKVTMQEVGTMVNSMWVTQNFQTCLAGFSIRADPDGMIGELLYSKGHYNAGHPANTKMDALVDKARQTYDLNARTSTYTEIQELGFTDGFAVYFFYSVSSQASRSTVGGAAKVLNGVGKQVYTAMSLG